MENYYRDTNGSITFLPRFSFFQINPCKFIIPVKCFVDVLYELAQERVELAFFIQ